MSENVMKLDSPFSAEAFEKLDINQLSIPELADRIRIGDGDSMLHMYHILHDDLYAVVKKTIASEHQAEFIIHKSFAEVFNKHEDIDPEIFELNLFQVISENIQKLTIHNTYAFTFNHDGHAELHEKVAQPTVQEVTSPLISSLKAKAVPAKLATAAAAPVKLAVEPAAEAVPMELTMEPEAEAVPVALEMEQEAAPVSDYSDIGIDIPLDGPREREESLTKTLSLPVILSSTAALAAAGVGGYAYHKAQEAKKSESYAALMQSLNVELKTAEDGTEVTTFEYQPGTSQQISDLIVSHTGDLETSEQALDLSKVGSTLVSYSLSATDEYEQMAKATVARSYRVVDTQMPIIATNVESMEITAGDSFDAFAAISSVVDPADGELQYVETEPEMIYDDAYGRIYENGWYTVNYDVNTSTAGEYGIYIHAVDNHGNVTDATIPVTVKAKPVAVSNAAITGTASVNTGANASSIYNLLTGTYGFTKAAASGLLANMQIESSFNPAVGTSYYGLCQWGGSRLSNLVAYCAANGYSSSGVDGQVAFMVYEMGGMTGTMNSFSDSAEGAAEAGVYFRRNFERSAGLNNVANIAASFYNAY